jgi:antibiotic biosynthesis monooxygenase (ABM) superfamily enzyme
MPIHIAITRRVRPGCEAEFQQALREFFQTSFTQGGVLGASMLTPLPGSDTREYGILRTFANEAERDAFYESPMFKTWDERAKALTEGEPVHRQLHGLEAWFRSPHQPPPRWKMAVVTLIGVYPTSLFLSFTIGEATHSWPVAVRSLVVAASMVALLTWVVMPSVTRLLHNWLNPQLH